ncbi:type II toxin-antitoxin system RelE/ParE family toxin [Algoriphagus aquimarinus]
MNYRISKQAANDLEKIWIYTYDNWSTQQADKYINLVSK